MGEDLERNKAVVREHFHALDSGEYSSLSRLHDPAGRNHAPGPFDLSDWPEEGGTTSDRGWSCEGSISERSKSGSGWGPRRVANSLPLSSIIADCRCGVKSFRMLLQK